MWDQRPSHQVSQGWATETTSPHAVVIVASGEDDCRYTSYCFALSLSFSSPQRVAALPQKVE